MFLDQTPDSGLQTPDSGLIYEPQRKRGGGLAALRRFGYTSIYSCAYLSFCIQLKITLCNNMYCFSLYSNMIEYKSKSYTRVSYSAL